MAVSMRGLAWCCLLATLGLILPGCADGNADRRDGGVREGGMADAPRDASSMDANADVRLEPASLCEPCVSDVQCGSSARCLRLTDGTRACAAICNPDIPSCPRGF